MSDENVHRYFTSRIIYLTVPINRIEKTVENIKISYCRSSWVKDLVNIHSLLILYEAAFILFILALQLYALLVIHYMSKRVPSRISLHRALTTTPTRPKNEPCNLCQL